MFTGSINSDTRRIVKAVIDKWDCDEYYIGCSGNFTVERVLQVGKPKRIHSNDVSLYSCAVGGYLTGKPLIVMIKDEGLRWLEEYIKTPQSLIATLLICTQYLMFEHRRTPYHARMAEYYETNFKSIHAGTLANVKKALENTKITDYFAGDVIEFISNAPDSGAAFLCFPPTYKGGYERLYKRIDEVFEWLPPQYSVFDDNAFNVLVERLKKKEKWLIIKDEPVPDLAEFLHGAVKTSDRAKMVYIYVGNCDRAWLGLTTQRTAPLLLERLGIQDELTWPVTFVPIKQDQMNTLRSMYLSKSILPASADVNVAVLSSGRVIGAVGVSRSMYKVGDVYMMSDFPVLSERYKRMAKLILAVVLSKEFKTFLEGKFVRKIDTIATTAFTDNPVSMKYRGMFELASRNPGKLGYIGQMGRWTLKEGFELWLKNHSTK
jgi:hypothetical protein